MTHELKILPVFYKDVISGIKTFELRKMDRDFKVGDYVKLRELGNRQKYSGRECLVKITYLLDNFTNGLQSSYCIWGFTLINIIE